MKHYIIVIVFLSLIFSQEDRSTLFSTGNPPELGEGWNMQCSAYSSSETGDLNQDGNTDVLDVVSMVSSILGNSELSEEESEYADANQDQIIDVLDVVIVVNLILNGNSDQDCISALSGAVKFTSLGEYTFEAFSLFFETEELIGNALFEVRLHADNFNSPGDIIGLWDLSLNENIAMEYYVFTGGSDCIILEPGLSYWLSVHPIDNQNEVLWLFSENEFTHTTSNDLGVSWQEPMQDNIGCTKIYGEQIYESGDYTPGNEIVYDWSLEDLNENSEYYSQFIGPSTFIDSDQVSVYYFGKAG
jgi:hypothetical protein